MLEAIKPDWTEVQTSTNINSVWYDQPSETLAVKFHNGNVYSYADVSLDVYTGLLHAASAGRYLNTEIKGTNPYSLHPNENDLVAHVAHRRK